MNMKLKSEKGSYTVEACISLFAFLIAIYFVFLQINTLILENVLQKAANNAAIEISCYSYILDRIGVIPNHDKDEMKSTQNAIDTGKATEKAISDFTDKSGGISSFVKGLFEDPDGTIEGVNNIGASLGDFVKALEGINWQEDLKTAGKYSVEQIAKSGINFALSSLYDSRIKSGMYLPTSYDKFCKAYQLRDKDLEFKVMFMPDDNNNTVLVSVSCSVYSPIKIPGFDKRTIVKTAYSPLWVG